MREAVDRRKLSGVSGCGELLGDRDKIKKKKNMLYISI